MRKCCSGRGLPRIALCFAFSFLLCQVSLSSISLAGENVTYDDSKAASGTGLQTAIVGGATFSSLFPGTSSRPGATDNTVTVDYTTGTSHPYRVFGGLSDSAAVTGNTVNFLNGTVTNNLYGGYDAAAVSDFGASNNSVNISGGTVGDGTGSLSNGWVFGGYSQSGAVSDNTVTIRDSAKVNHVSAGASDNGPVTGNKLFITGGNILGAVARAAWSDTGLVSGNEAHMSGGIIHDDIANSVSGALEGGLSRSGDVENNSVTMSGGSVSGVAGGRTLSGDAKHNSVKIFGNAQVFILRGGMAHNTGNARNNAVLVSGGARVRDVFGGQSCLGDATGNTADISGGMVGGSIFGGYSGHGAATGNRVTISGGSIHGDVYGGFGEQGMATDNSLTISGNPIFDPTSRLYGGYSNSGDAFTGNTLNLCSANLTVAGVYNFQRLNFAIPASLRNGGAMLTISGGTPTDLTGTNVAVTGMEQGAVLKPGSTVTLISLTRGEPASFSASNVQQGVSLFYDFTLFDDPHSLSLGVSSVRINPQLKSLSEGFLSGTALMNQGADIVAGQGMANAVHSAGTGVSSGYGPAAFGALSGGWSRYKTGSHVDMSSISLMTGLAWGKDFTPGRLTLGAFFEYGNGSYDTYNSFSNAASMHGEGDMYHIGGGVLSRMDFTSTDPGHFYAEASGRAGRIHNEYDNGELRDSQSRKAEYDSSSTYYGVHVGMGYVWNITDAASLDLYGKYFWTRQEGDSVRLSTGDPVRFNAVDSHRLRLGSRFACSVNEYVSPYVGAAWEHEFDGKARASTHGFSIGAPCLRGDTGIGEIGLSLKPSQALPLSFDLGAQGYVGKREGVTGSLQAKFEF